MKQIFNNPNAPFINSFAKSSNTGLNYFAVGDPSLTNYLETVGGSNSAFATTIRPTGTIRPAPRISPGTGPLRSRVLLTFAQSPAAALTPPHPRSTV